MKGTHLVTIAQVKAKRRKSRADPRYAARRRTAANNKSKVPTSKPRKS